MLFTEQDCNLLVQCWHASLVHQYSVSVNDVNAQKNPNSVKTTLQIRVHLFLLKLQQDFSQLQIQFKENGPFAAYGHMVQNPPRWWAIFALGHPKQRKFMFDWISRFVLGVNVRSLLSRIAGFCTMRPLTVKRPLQGAKAKIGSLLYMKQKATTQRTHQKKWQRFTKDCSEQILCRIILSHEKVG